MGRQSGQILLIVILVIITASTIGLSLASRSIMSLRNSSEEAESQEALAAAEAGVERAMQGSILPIGTQHMDIPSNKSKSETIVAEVTENNKSKFLLNGGNAVPKSEGIDVWFVEHDPSTGEPDYSTAMSINFLQLYWGSSTEACGTSAAPAAIQAIVVSKNKATGLVNSYRYVYDSCTVAPTGIPSRQSENNFTKLSSADTGSFTIDGVEFKNKTPVNDLAKGINDVIFIRVVPLYKDTIIGISSCNPGGVSCKDLPSQGYVVTSTGTSGLTSKKISVFKGYPQVFLPYISYGFLAAED